MRWDSSSGQYDMGFRNYAPGLNQFLTRDMYKGALADAGLTTDPFTGNRYAFGAGNPITNIELDGHTQCDAGYCPTQRQTAQVTQREITAYKNEVAWYKKQAAAAENQALSGCRSGPCMMNVYHNFQNPAYVGQQVQQYLVNQQIQAANRQAYLEQQRAEAASGCGFLGLSCAARWVGQQVTAHWRGLAQIVIGAVVAVATIACIASVICGVSVGTTIAGTTVIGAAAGAAGYAVSGRRHTLK